MASRKSPFLKVFTKREPKFQLHESTMSFMSDDMGDLMKFSGTGARKSDLGSLQESCSESHMGADTVVREAPSPLLSRSSSLRDLQSHLGRSRRNKEFTEDDGNRSQNTAPVQGSRSSGLHLSPGRSSSPRRSRISPGSLKIKGLFSSAKSPFSSKNKKEANSNILGELAISSLSGDDEDGPSGSQEESASNDESNHSKLDDGKTDAQATVQQQQQQQQQPDTGVMRPKKRRGGRRPGRKLAEESENSLQNLPPADAEAKVRTFNRSISTDTFAQFELGDHVPIKEKKPKASTSATTTVDVNTEKTNSSSSSEDESDASSSEDDDEESVTEAAVSVIPSATEHTDDTNIMSATTSVTYTTACESRGRRVRVAVRQRRKASRSRGRSRGKSRGRTPKSNNTSTTEERRRSSKDVEDEVRELLGLKPVNGGTTRKKEAPVEKDHSERLVLPASKQMDDISPNKRSNMSALSPVDDVSPKRSSLQTPSQIEDSPLKRSVLPKPDASSAERSVLLVPCNTESLRQVLPSALNTNKFGESMAVLPGGEALLDMDAGPVPTPRRSVFGSLRKVLSDRSFSLSPRRMKSQRSLSEDIGLPGLDASRRQEEDEPLVEILDSPRRNISKSQKNLSTSADAPPGDSAKKENPAGETNDVTSMEVDQVSKEKVEATQEEQSDHAISDDMLQRKIFKSKRRSKTPTPKTRVKNKMGRLKRRASLNNVSTSVDEEIAPAVGGLDNFVAGSSNSKTGEAQCASPTKGRRASQSTRPRRKMSVAELEKSTTSLVAIDAIRDVGGSKGKSPRRRIRKRMTVDYSATENDNKSSDTTDKIRNLYTSPVALIEGNESSDHENEAAQLQTLVAIVDDESDVEESDIEPVAEDETDALEHTVEEKSPLKATEEATDHPISIVTDVSNEASKPLELGSSVVSAEVQLPKNESVEDVSKVGVEPPSVVESIKVPEQNLTNKIPSEEEMRREYARLQSELNLSKMRKRLASMEVSNLEREIQQLKDRLSTFQDF